MTLKVQEPYIEELKNFSMVISVFAYDLVTCGAKSSAGIVLIAKLDIIIFKLWL